MYVASAIIEPMTSSPQDRYDRVAISLHWIVGAGVLAQLAFGWTLGELKRGTPARAFATNLHKSTGLLLAFSSSPGSSGACGTSRRPIPWA